MRRVWLVLLLSVGWSACASGSESARCALVVAATAFGEFDSDVVLVDEEGTPRKVSNDGRTFAPSFSPDGSRIAATRGQGQFEDSTGWPSTTVVILDLAGTELQSWKPPVELGSIDSPAWSPDGEQIAVVAGDRIEAQTVTVAAADGTQFNPVAGGTRISSPAWSPDGDELAFTVESPSGRSLRIVEVATGETTDVVDGLGQGETFSDWSTDGRSIFVSWSFNDTTGQTRQFDAGTGEIYETFEGDSTVDHPGGMTWLVNRSTDGSVTQLLVNRSRDGETQRPVASDRLIADLTAGCASS